MTPIIGINYFFEEAEKNNGFMRDEQLLQRDPIYIPVNVLLDVLLEYKKHRRVFEYLCCLYATAPFVDHLRLQEGMNLLKANDNV